MSNSVLTNIGLKAMAAQFAGLQTTGHNIANASVAGYSRQQVELATTPGQWKDGAFFGRGVDVAGVTRSHDAFLTREAGSAASLASMDSARLEQLTGLENIFMPGENGLGDAASQFFKAMVDVSSQPSDLSSRRVSLARASDMAARFREAGDSLDSLQSGVTTALGATVTEINGLVTSIATVNQQISSLRGMSQPPNDLLDQRDQLVAQLSKKIRIDRVDASDGSTSITMGGGQQLVLGTVATQLRVVQDAADPTRSALSMFTSGTLRPIDPNSLGGGAVAGLLQFQNDDLVQGRNLIGRLAAAVGLAVNAQQARGVTLQPPLGSVGGAPVFDVGLPRWVPNAANAKDGAGAPIGSVTMNITDPSALKATDYKIKGDGGGNWTITTLPDGTPQTFNNGDTVDGVQIVLNNPQPGDSYLLQPVGRAANSMKAMLTDPRDLAAASPLVATTSPANTGTVKISGLQVTTVPLPAPGATVQISFTSDAGHYDWSLVDAGGILLNSGSSQWQTGKPLPTPPTDFNGFSMQIEGVPRNGDNITIAPTSATGVATNNGNALSLMALQDASLVEGRTANDGWAQAMADVGVRVQSSKTSSSISTAVAQQAEQARSSQSGVNLDEEAARLIQYQQGYQAAAKVLSVAQTIFDTLLQATGR
jgi:flagellar hook-associated protein 1 FlgK